MAEFQVLLVTRVYPHGAEGTRIPTSRVKQLSPNQREARRLGTGGRGREKRVPRAPPMFPVLPAVSEVPPNGICHPHCQVALDSLGPEFCFHISLPNPQL